MANIFSIEYKTTLPTVWKPSSIIFIQPVGGNAPQVFITDKTGANKWLINPAADLSGFLKTVNNLPKDGNGNTQLDLSFANGILNLAGSGVNVNLDARYVKDTDFQAYKNATNNRLDSLEAAITQGLKTPVAFDATQFASGFPTQQKGFTYKVTVAGTINTNPPTILEVGDTIIYDQTGNNPFVVQSNVDNATTTIRGLIRLATQIEVDNGLDTSSAVVPATLQAKLVNFLNSINASQAEVNAGTVDNKFITPLKNKTYWDNRKATQAQVNAGTDDTNFVTSLKLETRIAAALAAIHTHANMAVLNKFSEGTNGEPIYNGSPIYTLGAQEW